MKYHIVKRSPTCLFSVSSDNFRRIFAFVMSLSVGDQERANRALKRNIVKRDAVVEQLSILLELVKQAKDNSDVIPDVQARAADIELSLTDLRIEQDAILEHLIDLERDSEFATTQNVH